MGLPPRASWKMPFNPLDTTRVLRQRLKGSLKPRSEPVWVEAMNRYPPAPAALRSAIPSEVGAFVPEKSEDNLKYQRQKEAKRSNGPIVKDQVYKKPRKIVYPEDNIRKAFYKTHPYELDRPLLAIETEESVRERDWSTIEGGKVLATNEELPVPLSAESCIQHALYLMRVKNMTRYDAYRAALEAFYDKSKQQESLDTEQRRQELFRLFPEMKKPNEPIENVPDYMDYERPWLSAIQKLEQESTEEGKEYMKQITASRQLKIQSQNEAYSFKIDDEKTEEKSVSL